LTPDGKLATYTAACGPLVYRGDQFPKPFSGAVFLCEPSANLIRCDFLSEQDGVITATNAFPNSEFLASTDERFRPVTLANGPDGALYVVDLARGLIQHKIFLTSYLRKQTESRHLEQPVNLGRIYRIVHDSSPIRRGKHWPATPDGPSLVAGLSNPNGFWRDTAQQLLVERQDSKTTDLVRRASSPKSNPSALGRLHALWTLEGLGALDTAEIQSALADPDPRVVAGAIHVSETLLKGSHRPEIASLLLNHAGALPKHAQLQLLLTLGELRQPEAETAMRNLLLAGPASPLWFDAAVSGLAGRELEFLGALAGDALRNAAWADRARLYSTLAQCVVTDGKPDRLARLLDLIPSQKIESWERLALLDGVVAGLPPLPKDKKSPAPRLVRVAAEPNSLLALSQSAPSNVLARITRIANAVTWPGKPLQAGAVPDIELSIDEKASFERGKELYTTICGACHQPHGRGQEGLAPPLLNSDWALGSQQRLVRIVLHGLRDAVTVNGAKYSLNMPALGEALNDGQIADALTYIRHEWGHAASAVSPNTVAAIRAIEAKREDSWTEGELLKQP
jgi:mono/diheme cytochrome c family protein